MFEGSHVAIVTPFKSGAVDFDKLGELIEFQLENGTHGIVPCGTTGESPTLSHAEHEEVVRFTVETVDGRAKVIAGSGSNNTAEAVSLTQAAEAVGADGALVITPYYNKPTQEGLYRHFSRIAESSGIPLVLYNVPSRTGVNMLPETTARLAELPTVQAVKEATGNVAQASQVIELCDIEVLSGEDGLVLPLMAVGGKGVISVVANVAPGAMSTMVEACLAGQFIEARVIHLKLFPLSEAMFFETNPTPVKTALKLMGMYEGEFRLPICEMGDTNTDRLAAAMNAFGLI